MTETAPNAPDAPSILEHNGEKPFILGADWTLDPVPYAAYWSSELQDLLDDRTRENVAVDHPATTAEDLRGKGTIVVPAGFEFDGASIPEEFEGVVGYRRGDRRLDIPSLAHDWLYTNHQFERHEADDLFYYLLRQDVSEIPWETAFSMWDAVTEYGESHYANEPDDIAEATALYARLVEQGADIDRYRFPPEVRIA